MIQKVEKKGKIEMSDITFNPISEIKMKYERENRMKKRKNTKKNTGKAIKRNAAEIWSRTKSVSHRKMIDGRK